MSSGLSIEEVSRRVGTSIASVCRWKRAAAEGCLAALAAKPVPGRPRKLQKQECPRLLELLLKGAVAYGYPNELWTLKRIARMILREFGVRYHPNHVWRLLRQFRWSCQVPERRPVQRDEQAVEHWKRYQWPHIKKARELGAHLAFLDESGFLLIPTRRRTWGPQGQTPRIPYSYKHDRISALATLTVSPIRRRIGLYARFQQDNFKAIQLAPFLRHLLRHLPGPVMLLWDQGEIHKGSAIRQVLRDYPRLHTEWFPKYAPELNPAEQVWNEFKGHTANSLPPDKQDIRNSLHANTRRVRRSQDKLRSLILASKLPSPLG